MPPNKPKKPSRRKDPQRRHIDPQAQWSKVRNAKEGERYVLVYKPQIERYQDLGYRVVKPGEGPRLQGRGTRPEGEFIEARGHVLMAISQEDYQDLVMHGEDGNTGTAYWDELEQRIVDPVGADMMRGLRGPYFQFQNMTTEAHSEG